MAPNKVTTATEEEARLATYFSQKPKYTEKSFKYKVGNRVRITHLRQAFSREYDHRWSGEIFTIARRFRRVHIPVYKLKDYDNDDITGGFYQQELQKVDLNDNDMFKIESIIKTRGKGAHKQYFVKWLYWPKKFNSWINATDVERV